VEARFARVAARFARVAACVAACVAALAAARAEDLSVWAANDEVLFIIIKNTIINAIISKPTNTPGGILFKPKLFLKNDAICRIISLGNIFF